jgi:hypothetical protein
VTDILQAEITAFVARQAEGPDGYAHRPLFAADPGRVEAVSRRFGLPERLD